MMTLLLCKKTAINIKIPPVQPVVTLQSQATSKIAYMSLNQTDASSPSPVIMCPPLAPDTSRQYGKLWKDTCPLLWAQLAQKSSSTALTV